MSTSSEHEKETVNDEARKKRVSSVSGQRVERRMVEKLKIERARDGRSRSRSQSRSRSRSRIRSRDRKGNRTTRKGEKKIERRPQRDLEDTAKRDRYSERKVREVTRDKAFLHEIRVKDSSREMRDKESSMEVKVKDPSREAKQNDSPKEVREKDLKKSDLSREKRGRDSSKEGKDEHSSRRPRGKDLRERDSSREMKDRDSPRELNERDSSRDGRDKDFSRVERNRDSSRSWRGSERWRRENKANPRGMDLDDSGHGRGLGRRQVLPERFNASDGRSSGGGFRGWRDEYYPGDRVSHPRRTNSGSQSRGEKWKHDLFESLIKGPNAIEPEEDPVAKVEALLAS